MADTTLEFEIKEVYANFGLALYLAQCLEHGLVNAFVFAELIPNRASVASNREQWEAAVDSFMDASFRLTLGRMVHKLAKSTAVDPGLAELLAEALEKRNWLAHHYFRERADAFLTSSGRATMIAELEQAQTIFREADFALEEAVRPARLKAGLTDEKLAEAYAQLRVQVGD